MNGSHSFTEGSDCHLDTTPSVVKIPPIDRGYKHQLSLLTDVENAMRANNSSGDVAWKKDNCQCDESVGMCPCQYCCIHDALRRCQSYFRQNVAHRDVFMPRKAFEQIVQTLKDSVNDAMAYGESESDDIYEATVSMAEELLGGEQKDSSEIATQSPESDSSLPAGVSCACGVYTKTNSDLFIDRDMKPEDLRAIASHVEAVGNLTNLIQCNVADGACLSEANGSGVNSTVGTSGSPSNSDGNSDTLLVSIREHVEKIPCHDCRNVPCWYCELKRLVTNNPKPISCSSADSIGKMEITSADLLDAAQLLDDCLISIYPDEFKTNHIEAAAERFGKANGTISRIAHMADKLRCASKKLKV